MQLRGEKEAAGPHADSSPTRLAATKQHTVPVATYIDRAAWTFSVLPYLFTVTIYRFG